MNASSDISGENTSVQIPKTLAERVQRRLTRTDFGSVDQYVTYVLDQLLSELEGQKNEENVFSKEDQESVEQRLKDWCYL